MEENADFRPVTTYSSLESVYFLRGQHRSDARYAILELHHLPHEQVPIPHRSAPLPNLGCRHVALGKEIAAQAGRDLAGIDAVVPFFPLPQSHAT